MKVKKEQNPIIIIKLSVEEARKLNKIVGKVRIDQISADEYKFAVNFKEKLKKALDNESV